MLDFEGPLRFSIRLFASQLILALQHGSGS